MVKAAPKLEVNGMMANRKLERLMNSMRRKLSPSPVKARHMEYSMLYSEDDSLARPSDHLIDLSLEAVTRARQIDLDDVCRRLRNRFQYPDDVVNLWPGEHYRLLAGIVQTLRPKLVVEIGTAEGLSALSMLKYLPSDGQVVTFDIASWSDYPRSCLAVEDFLGGRLRQIVEDLGKREVFERHHDLLNHAELVFIDAAKDGVLKRNLISNFETMAFVTQPIFVFDDIRLWNMLAVWRELRWPKLDLTSFGHWYGTGICELKVAETSARS